jgi:hypothetical protein
MFTRWMIGGILRLCEGPLIAWLQNFRHIVSPYVCYADNYLGFVHLGCVVILLRWYL